MERYELSYKQAMLVVFTKENHQKKAQRELEKRYSLLEKYIEKNQDFKISYEPIRQDPEAPGIVRKMIDASAKANVGPMAAVAGTMAEEIRDFLLSENEKEVIVENGGDFSYSVEKPFLIGLYAGDSPFSNRLGLKIKESTEMGVCTSSATVGHSVSFGDADAVIALAKSTPLADACATAIGNVVEGENGVKKGIDFASEIDGLKGLIIIRGQELGTGGHLPELVRVKAKQ